MDPFFIYIPSLPHLGAPARPEEGPPVELDAALGHVLSCLCSALVATDPTARADALVRAVTLAMPTASQHDATAPQPSLTHPSLARPATEVELVIDAIIDEIMPK